VLEGYALLAVMALEQRALLRVLDSLRGRGRSINCSDVFLLYRRAKMWPLVCPQETLAVCMLVFYITSLESFLCVGVGGVSGS
jgi:hypothetical protein